MQVIPLEIKLTCTFGTLDDDNTFIQKKDSFNIEIQKLDKNLFLQSYDELVKIKNELVKGHNPYASQPPVGNQA
jgi:hypothetical protein